VPIARLSAPSVATNDWLAKGADAVPRRGVAAGRRGEEMGAACAENRKRGFAMARSVTEKAISFHRRQ
jgi:hypothetical protein